MKKRLSRIPQKLELPIPIESSFASYQEFESAKRSCRACEIWNCYQTVVCSDGCKLQPKVVIVGECPGREEVEQGMPFVGKAGKLLRNVINKLGFRRNTTLITNVMPCRPLNNQFPSDVELVKKCAQTWLAQELSLLQPQALILLGNQPLKFLLGQVGITSKRGTWMKLESIRVMPTYHPSYVLRKKYMQDGPEILKNFFDDILQVANFCGMSGR